MKEKIKDRLDRVNKKIKPITQKQKDYLISRIKHPFLTKNKESVCPMCGQHFLNDKKRGQEVECPTCHTKGLIKNSKRVMDDIFYCITEKVEDFQVIRMFMVSVDYYYERDFEGNHSAFDFKECYRNFINEKGVVRDYARGMKPFASYRKDPYDWSKELHLYGYTGNLYYGRICDQYPFISYPYGSVQPWLKKRGFTGNFNHYEHISPLCLLEELLRNPITETIVKRKEYRWFELSGYNQRQYWQQMKICFRNHYYPKDISMWYDTLNVAKVLNYDISNPKFVCPKDLKAFHDEVMKKKRKRDEKLAKERKLEQQRKQKKDIDSYNKWVKRFYPICINEEGFEIKIIPCAEDFFELGEKMHQCLADREYYNNRDSIILSAWKDGVIIENAEVRLKDFHIIQCFGNCNQFTDFHEQIKNLISSNIKQEFIKHKITA